jgi:hypothetical protein
MELIASRGAQCHAIVSDICLWFNQYYAKESMTKHIREIETARM